MGRPVQFEIYASDPDRSRRFYEQVFGWRFTEADGRWVIHTGRHQPGIDGAMLPREGAAPETGAAPNAFVVIATVTDLSLATAEAVALGGSVRVPRTGIAGVGWLTYVADPDGNLMGILEPDRAAIEES